MQQSKEYQNLIFFSPLFPPTKKKKKKKMVVVLVQACAPLSPPHIQNLLNTIDLYLILCILQYYNSHTFIDINMLVF